MCEYVCVNMCIYNSMHKLMCGQSTDDRKQEQRWKGEKGEKGEQWTD